MSDDAHAPQGSTMFPGNVGPAEARLLIPVPAPNVPKQRGSLGVAALVVCFVGIPVAVGLAIALSFSVR